MILMNECILGDEVLNTPIEIIIFNRIPISEELFRQGIRILK
jgi:hypothetical protein